MNADEHNTSGGLTVCHPDQCCAGWCVDEIGLHDVDRDTAEVAAERACQWLADRLAAAQAEVANLTLAGRLAMARAESAEAEITRLRAAISEWADDEIERAIRADMGSAEE